MYILRISLWAKDMCCFYYCIDRTKGSSKQPIHYSFALILEESSPAGLRIFSWLYKMGSHNASQEHRSKTMGSADPLAQFRNATCSADPQHESLSWESAGKSKPNSDHILWTPCSPSLGNLPRVLWSCVRRYRKSSACKTAFFGPAA